MTENVDTHFESNEFVRLLPKDHDHKMENKEDSSASLSGIRQVLANTNDETATETETNIKALVESSQAEIPEDIKELLAKIKELQTNNKALKMKYEHYSYANQTYSMFSPLIKQSIESITRKLNYAKQAKDMMLNTKNSFANEMENMAPSISKNLRVLYDFKKFTNSSLKDHKIQIENLRLKMDKYNKIKEQKAQALNKMKIKNKRLLRKREKLKKSLLEINAGAEKARREIEWFKEENIKIFNTGLELEMSKPTATASHNNNINDDNDRYIKNAGFMNNS